MKLPSLLPKELHYVSTVETDRELYNRLIPTPPDLVNFFVYAAEDETWCSQHHYFINLTLGWMSRQAFEEKLLTDYVQKVAKAIQGHYTVLDPYLPKNITCNVEENEYPVSGLLLAAASPLFADAIRRECRLKRSKNLSVDHMSVAVFMDVQEYLMTGQVKDLWSKGKDEVLDELRQVRRWGLSDFARNCEELLERYVDAHTAVDMLMLSIKERLFILRQKCFEQLNQMDRGLVFQSEKPDEIRVEFLNYRDPALDLFEKVRSVITHLAFGSDLSEDRTFGVVVNRCPKLVGVDLRNSERFSDQLEKLPDGLRELDLSMCGWLDDQILAKMISLCPKLHALFLTSNQQIQYTGWSHLRNLTRLERLDISRCEQIRDEEFRVIAQACRGLSELRMAECSKITDLAFPEIAHCMENINLLDLSRTTIGVIPLIEIGVRCRNLEELNLTRCASITDEGILKFVDEASHLRKLILVRTKILPSTIEKLIEKYEDIEIIANP